jgi:predicted aldo/keto reductase-like oxidoreductase
MSHPKSGIDRRSFLKNGILGVAGMGAMTAIPSALRAGPQKFTAPKTEAKTGGFVTRKLGKTGITLPIVSMGVMNADNGNLVRATLDAGIVHLDTANGYQRGRNEEMIGKVLQGRPRDSYFIATKVQGDPRDGRTGLFSPETTGAKFLEMFEISLKRLGLEYVDILYIHNVMQRDSVLFEPLMKALESAKKSGKTRFVGVSSHSNEHEVIRAAIESKFYDVVLSGYNFMKTNLVELDKAIAEANQAGLGIIAMKTLAGSYFDRARTQPINVKAALKWALSNPGITTAIPGMTAFDHLEANLQVVKDPKLTDQDRKDLKLTVAPEEVLFCQQCNECLPQCPKELPIPSLMRGYMYAYGYRNLNAAYDLVASTGVGPNPCGSCAGCSVRCAQGFDVHGRVSDIVRLQAAPADFFA